MMTAVIGARGGVGASALAASLAWLMSDNHKWSTAMLDLDIHFGTGALSLDLEPGRGLTDAIDNPSRIDGLFIERAMVRASDKLSILSAEAPIHQPMLTDGSAFYQLQEEMRAVFECTVIDMPRNMLVQHPHLMADVRSAVLVTELTLAGARDMIRLLSWLKSNAPQTETLIVANRVGAGASEVSRKDFETSIERKIDFILPLDMKTVCQAAKLGKSVAEVGKSSKLGIGMRDICKRLMANGDAAAIAASDAPKAASVSLIGKLSGMKSMFAKKPKAEAAA
jgi:pilus assembly protein CpaE